MNNQERIKRIEASIQRGNVASELRDLYLAENDHAYSHGLLSLGEFSKNTLSNAFKDMFLFYRFASTQNFNYFTKSEVLRMLLDGIYASDILIEDDRLSEESAISFIEDSSYTYL